MNYFITSAFLIACVFCRLNSTSEDCKVYIGKFDNIMFDDYITYNQTSSNIIVTFGYYDSLYSNESYFGLTAEDGKEIESTCLDLSYFVFASSETTNLLQLKDRNLSRSNKTDWRYLSFNIEESELKSLMAGLNNTSYSYTVNYSVMYTIYDPQEIHYIQQFNFTILLSNPGNSIFQFPEGEIISDQTKKNINVPSEFKWCSDWTCNNTMVPDLYLNDEAYFQQTIVQQSKSQYYLIDTILKETGEGINKKGIVIDKNNSIKGTTVINYKVTIIWPNLTLEVSSALSLRQDSQNRFLMTNYTSQ